MADAIDAFPVTLPGLVSSHILKGCGHWVQRERPEDTSRLLTDWLSALPRPRVRFPHDSERVTPGAAGLSGTDGGDP